jgi:stage V sporulation protein R
VARATSLPRDVPRIAAKDYMEATSTRPSSRAGAQRARGEAAQQSRRFPSPTGARRPAFLLDHAPLERWQQDVLAMLRDEAYYFAPQGMTKIMNEGWAVYWHSKIMTRHVLRRERDR